MKIIIFVAALFVALSASANVPEMTGKNSDRAHVQGELPHAFWGPVGPQKQACRILGSCM